MVQGKNDEITDVIRHHWDARAATFDTQAGHGLHSNEQRQAWQELLSRLARKAPQRVLDIGCGTGFLALRLAELGHRVTGIDLAPQMLEQAREKAQRAQLNIEFRVENAVSLTDPDGTYDLVVARHVIWNLPNPAQGVTEWLRVLHPGGRLGLIEGKWTDNEAMARYYSRPGRKFIDGMIDAGIAFVARCTGRGSWRLSARKYPRLEAQLPFAGGPPSERLTAFLQEHGLHDVAVESLMDPILWAETPQFPRYLVTGTR